ncbi:hypothetical protein M409DRAFT_26383 [Zasmidium cellare ATCC 36951]|uniref:Protein kinase domain-containing protein n=1 Tax=Zasmidium cellare ATCC 36951 TaxID=1080233 RepID=A0A6A6CD23_ZASCE|nr:uncharacterized protein M409DRAFT_26383 [Zasmidium cellare ATCC 36951]KAF2163346.1 hypothetical protein M409DRAFT_26383 [Zasmidium cellare ATCC 36951]
MSTTDDMSWFWQPHKYVALKVGIAHRVAVSPVRRELELSKRIQQNAEDGCATLLRPTLDHFQLRGEDGSRHECLIHELLRESLWEFQHRFTERKLPVAFLKAYIVLMLKALDFLHTKCNYIHGDLKDENFLVAFEDPSVIQEYIANLSIKPLSRKNEGDRTIYKSNPDFGLFKSLQVGPHLINFGKAQPGGDDTLKRHPMQAAAYRAPEVLMGMPWSYSLDIWNLGVLIWNMMEDRDLFRRPCTEDGTYDAKAHVAQMIALLGHPPPEFLEFEKKWRDVPWVPCPDATGKICVLPGEFWGGPFFDDDGRFLYDNMTPQDLNLSDTVRSLDEDDKASFMDFASQILKWVPEQRKTAKELLEHPWLDLKAEARRAEKRQNHES